MDNDILQLYVTERSRCNLDGDFNIITVIVWVSGLDNIEQDCAVLVEQYLISHQISPWLTHNTTQPVHFNNT